MNKNIVIAILILGFLLVALLLDLPAGQEILSLRDQTKIEKERLEEKEFLVGVVEKLKTDYAAKEEILEKLDYILPSDQETPNIIAQLEALAGSGGVVLEQVKIASGEGGAEYRLMTIDLKIRGDYLSLKAFLSSVEENIRLMNVESIILSQASEVASSLFEFSIIIKTYYKP